MKILNLTILMALLSLSQASFAASARSIDDNSYCRIDYEGKVSVTFNVTYTGFANQLNGAIESRDHKITTFSQTGGYEKKSAKELDVVNDTSMIGVIAKATLNLDVKKIASVASFEFEWKGPEGSGKVGLIKFVNKDKSTKTAAVLGETAILPCL